jgi:hypothetical protein
MKRTPLAGAPSCAPKEVAAHRAVAVGARDGSHRAERAAVAGRNGIVCGSDRWVDPAHLLSASRRDAARCYVCSATFDMSATDGVMDRSGMWRF